MAGPRLGLVRWLLSLLDLLSLLFVALLEMLCLLLVALLYLLSPGFICILLIQTLMFLFLYLLEFLMFLLLFGVEPVLLLPVFLIDPGVAGVRRSEPLVWGKFLGMGWTISIGGAIGIRFAVGGRFVAPSRFPCRHGVAVVECSRPGSGCDGRLAMVYGGAQVPVGAGFVKMLILRSNRPNMPLAFRGLFFAARSRVNSTVAAVIADAVYCRIVVNDCGVVGIVNFRDINVVH